MFETVYLLATDPAFRKEILQQIDAALTQSGLDHYLAATRVTGRPTNNNYLKGRWGKTVADRYAVDEGWEKAGDPAMTMDGPITGPNKIDAVYVDPGPPPRHILSDAKALGSRQSMTSKGVLQMSQRWIEARLGNANLSRQARRAMNDGYDAVLLNSR
ncbi:hypothetical protein [Rhodovulum kholense]|uniref:Uncharacterized protein n=1 Tax=Rhodovulum kholense TaxID=453584 RepID=A0A8E2VNU5_9RHOB|nr:hypothetical protein [Rhodovulum kholense]PTW51923.1 hypothetical protein C8N38_101227 [Rhodovulum kholense]